MSRLLVLFCCIAACTSILGVQDVFAQKANIERPFVLVADPSLETPLLYKESVILIAPRKVNGVMAHLGVILNRPTTASMADLFPKEKSAKKVKRPVFLGGPVRLNTVMALMHAKSAPEPLAVLMAPGLYFTGDAKTIDSVIKSSPNDARYFVGCVIWRPGELEEELKRGLWFVKKVPDKTVFTKDATGLWGNLVQPLLQKRDGI